MHIVLVNIHIKKEYLEAFLTATRENAKQSNREPGVARFDLLQQQDDPTRFNLIEVYRTGADPARHKETLHYNKWRETVAEMMLEPRFGVVYNNIYPEDDGW